MKDRQAIIDAFLNKPAPVQLHRGEVMEVSGNWCTVRLLHSDLELDDVSLVAEEDAGDKVILRPKIGSLVLVGLIENDEGSLYVAQCGEVDGGLIQIGNTEIRFDKESVSVVTSNSRFQLDSNKAAVSQAGTALELEAGKVSVTNGAVTLKTLFDDLTTLLSTFIVLTAQGPSTAVSPTSITAINSLKVKVNQLLK